MKEASISVNGPTLRVSLIVVLTLLLSAGALAASKIMDHEVQLTQMQTNQVHILNTLQRIEAKIDGRQND